MQAMAREMEKVGLVFASVMLTVTNLSFSVWLGG